MRNFRTKQAIRDRLIESLETGNGIRTAATSMGSGSHHWWLTGDEESYVVHCYGSGRGWRDQDDDTSCQDLDDLVSLLWRDRANIIEEEFVGFSCYG